MYNIVYYLLYDSCVCLFSWKRKSSEDILVIDEAVNSSTVELFNPSHIDLAQLETGTSCEAKKVNKCFLEDIQTDIFSIALIWW